MLIASPMISELSVEFRTQLQVHECMNMGERSALRGFEILTDVGTSAFAWMGWVAVRRSVERLTCEDVIAAQHIRSLQYRLIETKIPISYS